MHATNRARWRAPWLVVALAAIGVMALAIGVVHFAPSPCPRALLRAAVVPAGAGSSPDTRAVSGEAVFYRPTRDGGKCSIAPLTSGGLYVSLPRSRYGDGALCGAYLDIIGPLGTVRAEVVDMCPGCSDSQLDLSSAAFARIQLPSRGTARVIWQLARDPVLPSPIAVRASPWPAPDPEPMPATSAPASSPASSPASGSAARLAATGTSTC